MAYDCGEWIKGAINNHAILGNNVLGAELAKRVSEEGADICANTDIYNSIDSSFNNGVIVAHQHRKVKLDMIKC